MLESLKTRLAAFVWTLVRPGILKMVEDFVDMEERVTNANIILTAKVKEVEVRIDATYHTLIDRIIYSDQQSSNKIASLLTENKRLTDRLTAALAQAQSFETRLETFNSQCQKFGVQVPRI